MTPEQTLEQSVIDAISEWVGETSSDHLVAAARAAVAALRAAGEPVAYKCQRCGYNRGQHAGADVAHCGEFIYAAQPAPSASVREIERELADCQGALDIIASKRIPDNKTQWGNERYYQGRKQSLEFVLGLISSTPSPLMAAGEAGETAPELTSDFAKALPGGPLDDSTYSAIEDALDAIDAPMTEGSRYMTLVERIMALRAAAGEAAPQASAESATPPNWIDAAALQAAHEIVALPENWSYLRRKAAIQVIVAREMMRTRIDAAARASETVEATSPAKRDYAARVMREAEAQMGALQEMKAAEDADIDFLIDNLQCGNAADRDVIRLFRKQIIQTAAAYAVQAMGVSVDPVESESDQVRCGPIGEDDWKDQRIASLEAYIAQLKDQQAMAEPTRETRKAAAMPMSVADIKKQFAEFMTDLADLTVEERAAEALLAARDYIAEDNNPKSNRVLQMIKIALEDLPATAAEPTREEIAAIIEPHAAGAIAHHGRGNASTQAVRDYDAALIKAAAILALKPRGGQTREGGK